MFLNGFYNVVLWFWKRFGFYRGFLEQKVSINVLVKRSWKLSDNLYATVQGSLGVFALIIISILEGMDGGYQELLHVIIKVLAL